MLAPGGRRPGAVEASPRTSAQDHESHHDERDVPESGMNPDGGHASGRGVG